METTVRLGSSSFTLSKAFLVYEVKGYGTNNKVVASTHPIIRGEKGVQLGPGKPLTRAGVRKIKEAFDGKTQTHFLPPHVLAYTDKTMCWHVRPQTHQLFFDSKNEALNALSGERFPMPGLIFKASHEGGSRGLSVWAYRQQGRPTPNTILYHAPFYNVNAQGRVCLGSMKTPEAHTPEEAKTWEEGFFGSSFTHGSGVAFLKTGVSYVETMEELAGSDGRFPTAHLIRTGNRLRDVL